MTVDANISKMITASKIQLFVILIRMMRRLLSMLKMYNELPLILNF